MKKISKKVVKLLGKKKLKISFAESCTGGLLSSLVTSINGSSKVFNLGLITYSNQSKINNLKVPKKTIIKHGAVSYETCLSMVKNLSKISKTNISVSITGVAGPKGGTKQKPVGLVYIGIKKGNIDLLQYFNAVIHVMKNNGELDWTDTNGDGNWDEGEGEQWFDYGLDQTENSYEQYLPENQIIVSLSNNEYQIDLDNFNEYSELDIPITGDNQVALWISSIIHNTVEPITLI